MDRYGPKHVELTPMHQKTFSAAALCISLDCIYIVINFLWYRKFAVLTALAIIRHVTLCSRYLVTSVSEDPTNSIFRPVVANRISRESAGFIFTQQPSFPKTPVASCQIQDHLR